MRRAIIAAGLVALACASAPARREASPPPRDRTRDPEFMAALEAAAREFETQADALAAGVYEPFVHPDSTVATGDRTGAGGGPDDPTTEELLGTLPPLASYNRSRERPVWTLQAGAFGTESGALVRLRQLASDFPDWPGWHTVEAGVFRVYVGRFSDRSAVERARAEVSARGYADAWIVRAP